MFITVGNIFILCSMKSRIQETMKIMNRDESDLYNKDITFTWYVRFSMLFETRGSSF